MNFQSIHYFLGLAGEKNFTRAAEKLHITQQTLSASLASLEKELGVKLMVRQPRLELTYAGKAFYRYALEWEKGQEDCRRTLADISGNRTGELRIGAASTRSRLLLPPVIEKFGQEYPGVDFLLRGDSNRGLIKGLRERELDLAIAHFQDCPAGIRLIPLYEEEIHFLIRKDLLAGLTGLPEEEAEALLRSCPEHFIDHLAGCPFLSNSLNNVAGAVENHYLSAAPFTPRIRAVSNHMTTLLSFCCRGLGGLFAPDFIIERCLSEDDLSRLFRLPLPETRYTISAGCPAGDAPWKIRDDFIGCLLEEVRRPGKDGRPKVRIP